MARRKKTPKANEGAPPRRPNGSPVYVSSSGNETHKKIRELPCYEEFMDRVKKGWTPTALAEWIQEQGHLTDLKQNTVYKMVARLISDLPSGVVADQALTPQQIEAAKQVDADINEIQEFINLYRRQKERLDIDFATEKNIGKLFSGMGQEMRIAGEFLKSIAQIKMDLGLYERNLGKVSLEGTVSVPERYEGTNVGKVLNDPKSRRKLLNIAEQALSMAKRGIDVTEAMADEVQAEVEVALSEKPELVSEE